MIKYQMESTENNEEFFFSPTARSKESIRIALYVLAMLKDSGEREINRKSNGVVAI